MNEDKQTLINLESYEEKKGYGIVGNMEKPGGCGIFGRMVDKYTSL